MVVFLGDCNIDAAGVFVVLSDPVDPGDDIH
jgi:hypothetical protein